MKAPLTRLEETVIAGGYCIGCGACAALEESPYDMRLDEFGRYQAVANRELSGITQDLERFIRVCPFSDMSANEDRIAEDRFGDAKGHHSAVGRYEAIHAGHVAEGGFRKRGSSGGMASWVLEELFANDLIDGAIHVKPTNPDDEAGLLFTFDISTTPEEARSRAKSRYYPVTMAGIMQVIRQRPGRYAVVGVPCFVKAANLLAREDPVLGERIAYTIGLVCGHLKSSRFAGMFAWQNGIHPNDLKAIDFRHKIAGERANEYGVRLNGRTQGRDVEIVRQNKDHFGYLWAYGFFKYTACDFCDDVFAETADVTVGDAWLPQFVNDSQGTNIVVVRNRKLGELIDKAQSEARLVLTPLSANDAARSQDAGLRHRRRGLAYRLWRRQKRNQWIPPKRVPPDKSMTTFREKLIFALREMLAQESHTAFADALAANDYGRFYRHMRKRIFLMKLVYVKSFREFPRLFLSAFKRLAKRT